MNVDARERILDAAQAELAARGFAAASTNTIAEAAGVAKGLVFHHFTSKHELALAVLDRVTERIIAEFLARDTWPTDLFERLYAFTMFKVELFQRDPAGYQVLAMLAEAPPELRDALFARATQVRARVWPLLLRGVSTTRLRKGLSLEAALDTIIVLGEGLERRIVARLRELPDRGASSMHQLVRETWLHYERLRDGLYAPPARPRRRPKGSARART